jgi:CBS domain-containing protein
MMNIAFFLLPKHEVVYVKEKSTLRQVIEKMEYHRYSAVPIVTENGEYYGTVTEGDLLWFIKQNGTFSFHDSHRFMLTDIDLRIANQTVLIDSNMEDLIQLSKLQNFVPVVDDMNKFIGIVRRSEIIDYCEKIIAQSEKPKELI